jgi:Uma2 family endonuclease
MEYNAAMTIIAPRKPARLHRRRTYTPEQFLEMEDAVAYEMLDDGTLQERTMGMESDAIAGQFVRLLGNEVYPRKLGVVLGASTGLQIQPERPRRIPRADAGFVSADRLPGGKPELGHLHAVPNLLIEVISPGDKLDAIELKVQEYLSAGVDIVWVVRPRSRTIEIWRRDGTFSRLAGDDEISGEDAVPGFRARVSEFFAGLD